MTWDWRSIVEQYNVSYVASGPSTAKNNIYVDCPFCGAPGVGKHHMGLSLVGSAWGCWKDSSHRGIKPARLLRRLLRITWEEADSLVGTGTSLLQFDEIRRRLEPATPTPDPAPVEFNEEFESLASPRGLPYREYLENRGFENPSSLSEHYSLLIARTGEYKSRIILPIIEDKKIFGWTARSIANAELRYKASSRLLGSFLFNFDPVKRGGRVLILVEGPFDALKLDYYGAALGVRAVALMGTALTAGKAKRLVLLSKRFDDVRIMLDATEMRNTLMIQSSLSFLGVRPLWLTGVKDAGELSKAEVIALSERTVKEIRVSA